MAEEAEAVEGAPAAEVAVPAGPIASPELLEACMLGKAMKIKSYLQKHDPEELSWPTAKNGWSCLQVAAGYGMADACRALVEAGAKLDMKDNLGMTALHAGSDTDETEVMRALLETDAGKAMVNVQDNEGNTPLHYASWSGRVDIVVELLRAAADVSITNAAGKTASEEAKEQKQDGVVKMIASGPPEPEGGGGAAAE